MSPCLANPKIFKKIMEEKTLLFEKILSVSANLEIIIIIAAIEHHGSLGTWLDRQCVRT